MNVVRITTIAFFLAFTSACSTVMVSTAPSEIDAKAKRFETIPGKAVIYIYRGGTLAGADYPSTVLLNGKVVSTGARNRYNVLVLNPGEFKLGITSSFQAGYASSVPIRVSEGKLYFIEEEWQFGLGFTFRAAPPDEARSAISEGSLVAWNEI